MTLIIFTIVKIIISNFNYNYINMSRFNIDLIELLLLLQFNLIKFLFIVCYK